MSENENKSKTVADAAVSQWVPKHTQASELPAPSGYRAAIRNAELLCETSPCQTVVIIRREDEIVIRDNSGVEGLTGDSLMRKSIALLEEIFERDNDKLTDSRRE